MYRLREIERQDVPVINRWRADPEIMATLGATFRFISLDVDEQWYDRSLQNRAANVRCMILEDGEAIGIISLTGIDPVCRSAELSLMIGAKERQNLGAGSFAVREMLRHGFLNLNLHRIMLTVLESNLRARRVYEKAGFVPEGTLRDANYKQGSYENALVYSMLREEYDRITPPKP